MAQETGLRPGPRGQAVGVPHIGGHTLRGYQGRSLFPYETGSRQIQYLPTDVQDCGLCARQDFGVAPSGGSPEKRASERSGSQGHPPSPHRKPPLSVSVLPSCRENLRPQSAGGTHPGTSGCRRGEPWSHRCPRPGWPQMGTEPSAGDPLRSPRAPTAGLTGGSDEGSRRAPRSLPRPLLSGTGTAQGHQKTQWYLPAVWRLTSVSPCDLTWSWGGDKQAQRTEPWATIHGSESQTHPGPKLRYHAPGSTLLSWRPRAEAMTAPEGKAARVPEEPGKAQARSPHLRAACPGPRAPGPPTAPITSLRLFTAGSQRAACTGSYHPPTSCSL